LYLKDIFILTNKLSINHTKTMKKLLLSLVVLAAMNACTTKETKNAEANAKDPQTGTFTSLDEKSAKVKELLEAYAKNDTMVGYNLFVDTVQVLDLYANNQEGPNDATKVNAGGRSGLFQGDMFVHTLNKSITVTTGPNAIKTFVFADGKVITGYWGTLVGIGRYTKARNIVPLHLLLYWEGDKVVKMYRMWDPAPMLAEIAASPKK
jgi:hypothetical protein